MNDIETQRLKRKVEKAKVNKKWDQVEKTSRRCAEYFTLHGRFEEALEYFKEELAACELQNDSFAIANANRMIGETYCNLAKFETSLEYINKYLEYGKTSRDKVEEQRALATIGRTYFCWASELKSNMSKSEQEDLVSVLKQSRKAYMKSLYICENDLTYVNSKERLEMKTRLLLNLGLVAELQNDIDTFNQFLNKAINLCKQENLFEELYKCYVAQASVYVERKSAQQAITVLDHAVELSKNLSNTTEKSVFILLQKSDLYLSTGNCVGAKNILVKAYKLKTPNETDFSTVIKLLKKATGLCKIEEKLLATSEVDFIGKKQLYEQLGDAWCSVKNYEQGIHCYLKMLKFAEMSGEVGKQLLPCYVSLAQTFKDNKQFDLALEYSEKELHLSEGNAADDCKTYLSISEILELKSCNYSEVTGALYKAKALSEASQDVKLQYRVLQAIVTVQRNFGELEAAEQTELEIKKLNIESSDITDSETEEETPDIGDEIDLNAILTDSDQEKEEYDRPRLRTAKSTYKVKRNEKGETQLHVAIIKGDIQRATRLIEQGHPVKEQDLNGWTPLHEACNHGHVDLVRLLLQNGADVNDAGGKGCNGLTPLHDAASCGHFQVIELLLNSGASVSALTNDGETPLDCFHDWRNRVELDSIDDDIYNKLEQRLKEALEATGFISCLKTMKISSKKNSFQNINVSKGKQLLNFNLRRVDEASGENIKWRDMSPERDDTLESTVLLDDDQSACKAYQKAMDGVRKRTEVNSFRVEVNKPNAALLLEEDYVDDWLEDDLGIFEFPSQKKRKHIDLIEHDKIRNFQPKKKPKQLRLTANCNFKKINEPSTSTSIITVQDAADTIEETVNVSELPIVQTNNEQELLPTVETAHMVSAPQVISRVLPDTAHKVRVRIESHVLLISIPHNDSLKIQWLSDEVSRRYYHLEGVDPVLRLKTSDGAILSEEDPVSIIYNEEIEAVVIDLKATSIIHRYKEARAQQESDSSCQIVQHLCQVLEICKATQNLNLEYAALTPPELSPVLQALKQEKNFKTLNFCGNVLGNEGVMIFCSFIEKIDSVQEINLSCNNITDAGVRAICERIKTKSNIFVKGLLSLDFSFNPISQGIVDNLTSLVEISNIRSINLEGCEVTSQCDGGTLSSVFLL